MPYCVRCKKLIGSNTKFCPTCIENMLRGDSPIIVARNEEERFSELIANLDNLKSNKKAFAEILDIDAKSYANLPIDEDQLSVRAIKRLKHIGIETQEQLLMVSPSTLMGLEHFGKGSLILVLKYLTKILGATNLDQKDRDEDIDLITLSDKQKQFLIDNCERFRRNEYKALKEENQESKELLQVVCAFEKQNWIDFDLLCSCLKDPQKAHRLKDTLVQMQEMLDNQQILKAVFDRLPAYKALNFARFYLLAYNCMPDEKLVLGKIYSDPSCTLDSVLKNPPESKNHIDVVRRFLKWCSFDVASDLTAFMNDLYKNDRARDVLRCRAAKMTLAEIGECYDVTRERIRQIELKSVTRFSQFQLSYRMIPKICADRNGDTVLTPAEISYYCGEYTEEVLYLLKSCTASDYRYSPSMDVFLVNSDGSEEGRIMSYVENLPDAFSEEGLRGMLRDAYVQEGLSEELVEQYIKQTYTLQDDRYVRAKLRRNDMYRHVMTKYYPNGIRIYDTEQLKDFKMNVCREFGVDSEISDRALAARLGDLGILCNRGTYKSKQDHYLSDDLAKDLESFIETNKSPVMPISYVYRMFKERLSADGVDNVYYFLGILHELFDDKFYIRKHYISIQKEGFNVYEILQKAIRDADRPLSRAQLQQVVPGVTPVVVNIAMDVPEILNYWGYYFHGEKTRISIQESRELEGWLREFLSDGNVHSSHEVYSGVQQKFPLVLQDNYAKDPNGCFSLLQYWFRDQFQFVRPYLAEKGVTIVKPSQLLREYIYSRDEIQIEDLSAYLKEIGLDRLSQLSLAKACEDKFFLVSNMKLVSIDRLGVDEQIAEEVESIILSHVVGTMPIRDLPCFQVLPKIAVDWSDWLVYSVLRKWSKKLTVGESYNQIRLAVPLIAKAGEYDTSVVFYDSKQQESFSADDLSKMDELLEDLIDWDDLDNDD